MTWVRLDDQWPRRPEIVVLSNDAKLLFLVGLTYSAAQLTNGWLPAESLRIVAADANVKAGVASELVARGRWLKTDAGYQVVEWDEYLLDSGPIIERRKAEHEKKSAGGKLGNHNRHHDAAVPIEECDRCSHTSLSDRSAISNRSLSDRPDPDPTPNPTRVYNSSDDVDSQTVGSDVDGRLSECIELAVKVARQMSREPIRSPKRFAAKVRETTIVEHSGAFAAALAASVDEPPDIVGIVASVAGYDRLDVVLAAKRGGSNDVAPF